MVCEPIVVVGATFVINQYGVRPLLLLKLCVSLLCVVVVLACINCIGFALCVLIFFLQIFLLGHLIFIVGDLIFIVFMIVSLLLICQFTYFSSTRHVLVLFLLNLFLFYFIQINR